jgi:ankyrin repeat protein
MGFLVVVSCCCVCVPSSFFARPQHCALRCEYVARAADSCSPQCVFFHCAKILLLTGAVLGHLDCLGQLHANGDVVEARDVNGATPLHAAAEAGQLACLDFLVERTGADLRAR